MRGHEAVTGYYGMTAKRETVSACGEAGERLTVNLTILPSALDPGERGDGENALIAAILATVPRPQGGHGDIRVYSGRFST